MLLLKSTHLRCTMWGFLSAVVEVNELPLSLASPLPFLSAALCHLPPSLPADSTEVATYCNKWKLSPARLYECERRRLKAWGCWVGLKMPQIDAVMIPGKKLIWLFFTMDRLDYSIICQN